MRLDLTGKTALVTGGARSIGLGIVNALADAGARVAFTYNSSAEKAEALRQDLEGRGTACLAIQGDAGDHAHAQEAVQTVVDAWGALDILVNNAGITRDTLLLRMSEEDWDAVIRTNLKSVFNFCKAAYRPMMSRRSGSVINISSVMGMVGNPGQANYTAAKAGIIGFTKTFARELGARGVRANCVAPGYIETDMTAVISDKVKADVQKQILLGRVGHAEDVAAAVVFLASDAAAYITGHVLTVDGGLTLTM